MTDKTLEDVTLDSRVYPLQAVQAAAYTFTDRAFVRIDREGEWNLTVRIKSKNGAAPSALADEFVNEVLHETLRRQISQANQKIREYVVTKALVSAQTPHAEPPAPEAACACAEETGAAPLDAALEKEIEGLLAKIEQAGPAGADPLGVAVSWEETQGRAAPAAKPAKAKPASKPKKGKRG